MSRRPSRVAKLKLSTFEDRIVPASPPVRAGFVFDGPAQVDNSVTSDALPASPSVAVGPTHTVAVTKDRIEWRTVATHATSPGAATKQSLAAFLSSGAGVLSTPRVLYDQVGQRFIVAAVAENTSRLFIARSNTSDPTGGWQVRPFNRDDTSIIGTDGPNDMNMATDEEALYVTMNQYLAGSYSDARVLVINKASLFGTGTVTPTVLDPSGVGEEAAYRSLAPAQIFGTPPSGNTGTYFVAYNGLQNGGNDAILFRPLNNPLTTPTWGTRTDISLGDVDQHATALPDAIQKDTARLVDTGDRRVTNAVWRNDRLYLATTINPVSGTDANQATAYWVAINSSTATLQDQGAFGADSFAAGMMTYAPSVMVDDAGNMAILASASNNNHHIKGLYAARKFADPAGTLDSVVELTLGTTTKFERGTPSSWGPYSGLAIDPSGRAFWAMPAISTTVEAGTGDRGMWATRASAFSYNFAPEIVVGALGDVIHPEDSQPTRDVTLTPGFTDFEDILSQIPANQIPLTFSIVTQPDPLLATAQILSPTNPNLMRLTFVPNAFGVTTVVIQATDSGGASVQRTIQISITPTPDNPTAVDDSYTTLEDTVLTVPAPGVLGNDFDTDPSPVLSAALVTNPSKGTIQFTADGSFIYTPFPNANGQDQFTYKVIDESARESDPVGTVTIDITPVNDAPTAVNDGGATYTTNEDVTLNVPARGVLINDLDVDTPNASLVAVIESGPSNAQSFMLNSDGSFSYTPSPNFNGTDTFTYRVSDGSLTSTNFATVTIVVNPVDDPPVANDDTFTTLEETQLVIGAPGFLLNDDEFDGQALTFNLLTQPSIGAFTLESNGGFTYTPIKDFSGSVTFTYTVSDGTTESAPATVTIDVLPVNDVSVPEADSYSTREDTALNVPATGVLANDRDVDDVSLNAVMETGPSHAMFFLLNSDGSFVYVPAPNFFGVDTFTYRADDGDALSAIQTVTIRVNAVQDPPTAVADSASTTGKGIFIPVLANDFDPDGDVLRVSSFTTPTRGRVIRQGSGLFYTPFANAAPGLDNFSYTISDGRGNSASSTIQVNVTDTVAPKIESVRLYYGPNRFITLPAARGILPWANVSKIEVVFSEPVNITPGNLTLTGVRSGAVTLSGPTGLTKVATWTFSNLTTDRYTARVVGAITDANGNALVGGWSRSFAVLPGDFDGDGAVTAIDGTGIKKLFNKVNIYGDINGDGVINQADVNLAVVGGRLT